MKKNFELLERFDVEWLYRDPSLARMNQGESMDGIARWLLGENTPATDR